MTEITFPIKHLAKMVTQEEDHQNPRETGWKNTELPNKTSENRNK